MQCHAQSFKGHLPGQPGMADSLPDSHSQFIFILNHLMRQAKTFNIVHTIQQGFSQVSPQSSSQTPVTYIACSNHCIQHVQTTLIYPFNHQADMLQSQ